jgi:hypothetical protein
LVVEVVDPGGPDVDEFGTVDELGVVGGVPGDVGVVGAELDGFELDGPVCVPGAVGDRGAAGAPGAVGALVDDEVGGAALDADDEDDDGAEVDWPDDDCPDDEDDPGADEDAAPPAPVPPAAAAPLPAAPPPAPPPDCA